MGLKGLERISLHTNKDLRLMELISVCCPSYVMLDGDT